MHKFISLVEVPGTPTAAKARHVRTFRAEAAQVGDNLLSDVESFLARFVAYPSEHARVAHVLWIAHTYLMPAWDSTPRLAALSPEPGSGKTRLMEVTELLVPRPVPAVSVTSAYLFRKVADEGGLPTVLFDETDTIFGVNAKQHEDIRAFLNAGHRRGAFAGRCNIQGHKITLEEIPSFCAVALAGLGHLPDTILSRCIPIRMRRRAPGEHIEPFRRRNEVNTGATLSNRLSAWADSVLPVVSQMTPDFPDGIQDRNADVWEPLLIVADAAGETWPQRARAAALAIVNEAKAKPPSLGLRLLADLWMIFGNAEVLATEAIVSKLNDMEEAPWGDLDGKPIDSRRLSRRLSEYGVKPKTIRIGSSTPKGYARSDLHDSWVRYLPAISESATTATNATDEPDG